MPIPSQKELTEIVRDVYLERTHIKGPVIQYQKILDSLPSGSREDDFVKYVLSSILGERDNNDVQFITVMEPPYVAWIRSEDFPVDVTDKGIEMLREREWGAQYPMRDGKEEKGEHVLIDDIEYVVAKACVERGMKTTPPPITNY